MDLFENDKESERHSPLAFRMRPKTLENYMGHDEIAGENGYISKLLKLGKIPSLLFWGPPGCGKTTLAMIIAEQINAEFILMSAVTAGIKEVKETVELAKLNMRRGRRTLLFIDEIHRFNKSQQDAFLPHVENGTLILIGATTENPSFEVNSALLSRLRVIQLKQLQPEAIRDIIVRALADEKNGLGMKNIKITEGAIAAIDVISNGDARTALNIIEMLDSLKGAETGYEITEDDIREAASKNVFLYDKSGEEHYNLISALHKSMRDSDPDAALYWCVRMLESGEDPLYVCRRLIRFASEDIGNADPQALTVSLAARDSFHFLGHPEGELAIAQAAVYLACAPKSNAVYAAFNEVKSDLRENRDDPVPVHLRNAPTGLMKEMGYGKGYKYAHDHAGNFVKQQHLPDRLNGKKYYKPTDNGLEAEVKERLKKWHGK